MRELFGDVYLTHILSGRCDIYAANVIMPPLINQKKKIIKILKKTFHIHFICKLLN